jgi:hypothetical protein
MRGIIVMRAVIHQVNGRQGIGAFPVAGRPLVVRQVQWLRAIGCDRIALEIDSDPRTESVVSWLDEDGLGLFVDVVLTRSPVGGREVARRAGIRNGTPFLAVPADVLGSGDLSSLLTHADGPGVDAWLVPPPRLEHAEQARVTLYGRTTGRRGVVRGVGWGARISTFRHAHELGLAALEHRLPVDVGGGLVIHAAEVRPGVWIGRGADVADDAELIAPVLIGAGATIGPGTTIGPGAVVGDRAIVEAGALVEHAHISADATVRDSCAVRDAQLTGRGLRALTVPPLLSVLPGARVSDQPATPLLERAVAVLVAFLLAPLALVASGFRRFFHALLAVVAGNMRLVGVGAPLGDVPGASRALLHDARSAPRGAIDVERALLGPGADDVERVRARAWYRLAKDWRLDLTLLARTLKHR